MSVQCILFTCT